MGSKIEFGPGSLYITDEDGNKRPLGDVSTIDFVDDVSKYNFPLKCNDGEHTFSMTVNLAFRERIILFGFWNTIRAMIKSLFKRGG